jgi:streptogramin lyase
MDVIKRKIFVLAVALSLCCLIGAVFAQTPVPESVSEVLKGKRKIVNTPPVFSNEPFEKGDVFAAVGNGQVQHYDSLGNLLGTLITSPTGGFTTGMATDSAGNLYVTNFQEDFVSKFTGPGVPHTHSVAFTTDPASSVESILFDKVGNIYVGQADGTKDILKYDAAGNFLMRYDVAVEDRGSDWIDLDADQQTMYYTSEGTTVKRYDVVNNIQLTDFATGLPGTDAYALRLIPAAAGGGMLIANTELIVRLDASGNVIQTYDVPGEDGWFALNLDPDLSSFWSADFGTDNFYKFDIASGNILLGPINTGTGVVSFFGLAVFGEFAAGQNNRPMVEANPPGPFFINQGEFLTFEVKASDIDPGDTLTLDVINLPPGAVMTPPLPATGTDSVISIFTWTPLEDAYSMQPGVFEVTYTAVDAGGLTDTVVVQINVNAAPVCSVDPPGPISLSVLTF